MVWRTVVLPVPLSGLLQVVMLAAHPVPRLVPVLIVWGRVAVCPEVARPQDDAAIQHHDRLGDARVGDAQHKRARQVGDVEGPSFDDRPIFAWQGEGAEDGPLAR